MCTAVSDTASLESSHSSMSHDAGSQHQPHPRRQHLATDLPHPANVSPQCNGAGDSPGTDYILHQLQSDEDGAPEDGLSAEYET